MHMPSGTLFLIATPIGNLEDITLRALRILKESEVIACEDTRHTAKLLSHFGISGKTLISFHSFSGGMKTEKILEMLQSGENVALCSDAGTPGISDPGTALALSALEQGIQILPIPGATALIPALSASGLPTDHFEFFGFLPHKKGRQTLIKKIVQIEHTVILYESTHRIEKFLEEAFENFPKKQLVLARELTKIYEEFLRGTAAELLEILKKFPEKKKGEFVVLISGRKS
ncbi:16S rRNA (cytidine(1402)-2'-O)-methyltransferase [Candidatus Peregrinibacteria bacterium]|nr:16S rRNA (cytidine(1402)-2'-O)-methyltransferase [Candidatus Peregrinibacteria bacterium]